MSFTKPFMMHSGCWNDREWEECLAEAVSFKMPYALRQRFVSSWFTRCPTMLLPFGTDSRKIKITINRSPNETA
ncbi:hypothetical protein PHMEG_00041428 [Phytophthora megakarya]|uniref:Uncharacterized protein n=1 Tax=Phytophthora megakarya TaxID=4795 RepID=A0A225UBR1_9STRA|nr:hypothetical protein PHMEG_00041428 [Phytophthora megakarya]